MEMYSTNPTSRLRIVLLAVLLVWAPSLFAKKPNIIVVVTDGHGWAANTYRGKEIPPRNERGIPLADLLPYKTGRILAEGGIRVPYVLSWPGRFAAGQVSDMPVSSLDVGTTAVDLAGLECDEALDGQNIFELLKEPAAMRPLFWRFWRQAAMRLSDWKYLRAGKHEFLFNLADDISEQNNLIKSEPERVASMCAKWTA